MERKSIVNAGMKRMLIFIVAAMPLVGASAQSQRETVYLHNGSVIKGEVIEAVPGESIKVKTADGSIFVYDMADVERIAKEQEAGGYVAGNSRGGHRGLDFLLDVGYGVPTEGGKGFATAEIGLGKRFNKNFYFGIGSGAWVSVDGGKPLVPVTADFRAMFPVGRARVAPGGTFRLGYVFNTEGDKTFSVGSGRYRESFKVEMPNYFMLEIMPSVEIPLSSKVDFNVALGYMHLIPVGDGSDGMDGSGYFMSRVGFGFHKGAAKPMKPVRDRGFQWRIEGGTFDVPDFNTGIVLSYKWNKNLSFGVGFGLDSKCMDYDDESRHGVMTTAFSDGSLQEGRIWAEDQLYFYKFFARGTWRFLDYRISPIVSCDLGVRWLANDNIYNCPYSIRDLEVDALTAMADEIDSQSYSGFYFSPAVGFSLRTANNLYLEAKIGYSFSSAIKEKSGSAAGRGRFYEYECSYTTPKRKLSAPFFSIGLTHTFRLGSNWGK